MTLAVKWGFGTWPEAVTDALAIGGFDDEKKAVENHGLSRTIIAPIFKGNSAISSASF